MNGRINPRRATFTFGHRRVRSRCDGRRLFNMSRREFRTMGRSTASWVSPYSVRCSSAFDGDRRNLTPTLTLSLSLNLALALSLTQNQSSLKRCGTQHEQEKEKEQE